MASIQPLVRLAHCTYTHLEQSNSSRICAWFAIWLVGWSDKPIYSLPTSCIDSFICSFVRSFVVTAASTHKLTHKVSHTKTWTKHDNGWLIQLLHCVLCLTFARLYTKLWQSKRQRLRLRRILSSSRPNEMAWMGLQSGMWLNTTMIELDTPVWLCLMASSPTWMRSSINTDRF